MRHLRFLVLGALTLAAFSSVASAEPQTMNIDRSHTEVGFNIRHFFTKVHGSFSDFSGTVTYDPANLMASSVEIAIKDSSIYTGNARRDVDLRGESFFWTEKYPLITFKSTKVTPGADDKHFNVTGDFTMRDVTKPVTLDVELLGIGQRNVEGRDMGTRAGFEAKTTINRKDWGIVWNRTIDQGGTMLADEVEIVLSVEAFTKPPVAAVVAPPATDKPADKSAEKTKSKSEKSEKK